MISLELDLHIFQEHYVLRQDRFLLKEYMYANESLEFAAQRRYLFINIYNFQIANFVSFFNSFFSKAQKMNVSVIYVAILQISFVNFDPTTRRTLRTSPW